LVLPDGQQKQGKLDAKGFARLENLPPGRCEVRFTHIEAREIIS